MAGTFAINWDVANNRLEFRHTGLFDEESWARWVTALHQAVRDAPRPGWVIVADLSASPPQNEAIQKEVPKEMAFCLANGCRKVAVISKAVTGIQTKRLASETQSAPSFMFVSSRQEALNWLTS